MPSTDIQVEIRGTVCNVEIVRYYANNRPAIVLVDTFDGGPYARASVNLPEVEMEADETAIKNWSENEGIMEILIDRGVISEPLRFVESGFVSVPICKIKMELPKED
jgi:hypothetical protein